MSLNEDARSQPGPRTSWLAARVEEHALLYPDFTPVQLIEAVVDQVCQLENDAGRATSSAMRADLRRSVAYEVRRRAPAVINPQLGSALEEPEAAA
jgi:hypothetical protein